MTARPDAKDSDDGEPAGEPGTPAPASRRRGRRPSAAASVDEQPGPAPRIPRQPRPQAPEVRTDATDAAVTKTPDGSADDAPSTKVAEKPRIANVGPDPVVSTTKPAGTQPGDAKPEDTNPAAAQPTATKRDGTKVDDAKTTDTKPTGTEADNAKTSGDGHADTKPDDLEATGTKSKGPVAGDTKVNGNNKTSQTSTTEVLSSGKVAKAPPQRAPAEWKNFAPPPARTPGALTRLARRTGRLFRFVKHEWTLTVLGGLALAAMVNWRALVDPVHTLPQDTWDPSLIAYLIAWDGHALLHAPGQLWQINAFFPSAYGLAYSDAFLGYAPFALLGVGAAAAILRYNIVFILAQALTVIGGYALVRQLGAARVAAAVAAVAFAMAPWRLGQAGHLQVLSTGGILLALAMLARGHGIRWRTRSGRSREQVEQAPRPPNRPGWAIAGWLCATWQVSLGFGIGLVFAYVLLGATIVGLVWWVARSRRLPSRLLLVADLAGVVIFAGECLLLAQPYQKVLGYYSAAARADEWIGLYSPPLRGFFTAPDTSLLWGAAHAPSRALLSLPGEMALLPGFALYALAAAGVLFSIWRLAVRLALLAGVVVTVILGLGTHGPAGGQAGYLVLLHHLPGLQGLRTPGRMIVWTTLLLALLAAGAVGALAARAGEVALRRGLPRPSTMGRLALLLPLALVLAEGLGTTPHVTVPTAPAAVATAKAPYLVLPSSEQFDMRVMLWSTDRFAAVVNGGSGLVPAEIAETRKQVQLFPDAASVSYLRELGVNTVVVLPDLAHDTPWESAATAPIDDLGITRDIAPDAVTFHLAP